MTKEELIIDLECYSMHYNTICDPNNLTLEDWAEFITILLYLI